MFLQTFIEHFAGAINVAGALDEVPGQSIRSTR